ncbi:putative chain-fatty-acid-CoA ligase FadD13 [Xenorhabdus vietnamensis]|uniref:Putative chain-fatty-acid-CoA ligase FadD13 n=1 Tax=Xenorhabdus vietnamensis TaxID=351656 RepID=A0A1Y2S7D0_9GAMM|nr:class I adenylate-forming enzyme family protein [Xenorhabdus vietnamensis]OTA14533.1 putative chain-fatty-acid-CoA ligase FadD13 [Xenorhabdus vietnamensis]
MYSNKFVLSHYLDASAALFGTQIAVIDEKQQLTYQQLRSDARQLAHTFQAYGVTRGDRVMLYLANSIAFVRAFWAAQYIGAVAVPINPDTKAEKIAWLIADSTVNLLIVDGDSQPTAKQALSMTEPAPYLLDINDVPDVKRSLETALSVSVPISTDLSTIIYTSGSTGQPKGVMLSHRNMVAASHSVAAYLDLDPTDRIFCALPLTFDYGLHQVTMSALVSATLIVERNFAQPLFSLHRLVKQQATVLPIVPTMLSVIAPLASRFDLSSIQTITNTAAALHPEAIDQLHSLFPSARVFSMYGLTECHRCTYMPPHQLALRKDSVGIAIPNTELWVVDEQGQAHTRNATGELVIRGDTVMVGYWQNPQKTAEKLKPGRYGTEHVLYTGDICRLDDQGYLYFVGRQDEILKSCGEKVAPKEVESVIYQYPGIQQVVVIGVPHPVYGDEIIAWIETDRPLEETTIKHWCKSKLESYMVPHRVYARSSLPRNNNGKIDKPQLQEWSQTASTSEPNHS